MQCQPSKNLQYFGSNSIISNDSANSSKRITKMKSLKNYKNIVDNDVREEEKKHKKSANITMIVATKRIYIEPVRKLHQRFNESQETPVSLTIFYNMKL